MHGAAGDDGGTRVSPYARLSVVGHSIHLRVYGCSAS